MPAYLVADSLAAVVPGGRALFSDLNLSLGRETVGLVGDNGSGKSTLLAILAGEAAPARGHVERNGRVAFLKQAPVDAPDVAGALGIAGALAALRRVEAGCGSLRDAEAVDWTLESRAGQALARVGLDGLALGRDAASLSGGERTRLGIAAMLMTEPDVLLLDEPTNNLDAEGRAAIARLIAHWPGCCIVASHDRALLEDVDRIVALSPTGVDVHGGGWSAFAAAREAARERAEAGMAEAERGLRAGHLAAQRRRERKARRDGAGRRKAAGGGMPRILMGARAERAENTASRERRAGERQIAAARESVDAARDRLARTTPLKIALPRPALPPGRALLRFEDVVCERRDGGRLFGPLSFTVNGPRRILVSGSNGAGKSTLLRLAFGGAAPASGRIERAEGAMALLDQHVSILDPERDLVENLRAFHPGLPSGAAHQVLARFGFRNRDALRPAGALSGGERLRAGLAVVTGGPVPPWMLLLDEPTNHLDIAAVELLEAALAGYEGAFMLVSHDRRFVEAVGCDTEIRLGS